MSEPSKNLRLESRPRRDGFGWYGLAIWGNRPPEQIGFFSTKAEAEEWIAEVMSIWERFKGDEPAPSPWPMSPSRL
jgi:hypothetical protein